MLYRPFRRFVALITTTFLVIGCTQAAGLSLSPEEALAKAQAGEITLIDVRTPAEWRQTGIASVAHRIDLRDPKDIGGFTDRVLQDVNGDKTAPIAVICRTGNRSGYVQQELESRGFTRVYNIPEGMAGSKAGPGWIRRGLPVQSCTNC